MTEKKKYYPLIFWDYPQIESRAKESSFQNFREFIDGLKTENPEMFDLILRRFIERGSLTEGVQLFDISDIENGLNTLPVWRKIPTSDCMRGELP